MSSSRNQKILTMRIYGGRITRVEAVRMTNAILREMAAVILLPTVKVQKIRRLLRIALWPVLVIAVVTEKSKINERKLMTNRIHRLALGFHLPCVIPTYLNK